MASDWPEVPLGKLVQNFDSRRIPLSSRERDKRRGPFPYHGATGVMDHVDDFLFEGLHLLVAEDGSVETTLGKPFLQLVDGRFWVNNHAHVLKGATDEDTRFLYYALSTVAIRPYISGSVQAKLSQGNLNKIPVPYPADEDDRHAIAHILGTLDDKIELNRRMNETLEAMARALFKSWFVDFDPVRAKTEGRDLGLPQSIADLFPDSFDEAEPGAIPRGWHHGSVGDLCTAIYSGGTPSTQEPDYWDGALPWLSSGETRMKFITDTEKRITPAAVEHSSTRLAPPMSTVIASAGQGNTRGQTSLLAIDSYVNQSVVVLVADPNASSPYHLFFDLERRYQEFRRVSDGHSSRGSLTTKLLAGLPSVLPAASVVSVFDSIARPSVGRAVANLRESAALASLRDALLPRLLSGELRVEDPDRFLADIDK